MLAPVIDSWMKQDDRPFEIGEITREVSMFQVITNSTGKSQVILHSLSTMCFTNDVINDKRKAGKKLIDPAVLTAIVCSLSNKFP